MRFVATALILSILSVPAFAADPPQQPRGGAVREACKADIATLCAGLEPGGGRIRECLKANREKLSDGCKAAIAAARQARKDAKSTDAPAMRPTTP
jgi:hypothetical protein